MKTRSDGHCTSPINDTPASIAELVIADIVTAPQLRVVAQRGEDARRPGPRPDRRRGAGREALARGWRLGPLASVRFASACHAVGDHLISLLGAPPPSSTVGPL